jgi:hypothetical protein
MRIAARSDRFHSAISAAGKSSVSGMETGLFEIQANHLKEFRQARQALPASRDGIYKLFGQGNPASRDFMNAAEAVPALNAIGPAPDATVELTRCFLRLANLPNFALDRLSRYEATLWRQARQTLLALDALDRHKPQERTRHFCVDDAHLRVQ